MVEETQQVPITNDGYARWLRAQRPPWEFFFTLSELEQEQLASIGDQQTEDVAYTVSLMINHADAYQPGRGMMGGDAEAEASTALRAAQSMAASLSSPQQDQPTGMAGIGSRISPDLQFRTEGQPKHGPALFGKEPDK